MEVLSNCDRLIIGVGKNAGKNPLFTAPEKRMELIRGAIDDFVLQYRFRNINGSISTVNETKAAEKLLADKDCVKIVSYDGPTISRLDNQGTAGLRL